MAPLMAFYGDDFTGSTASMEVLAFAGVPTMLFVGEPSLDLLADYPQLGAIGIAGVARSKDPAWMKAHLPACFDLLKSFGAPIVHYKVCSTFDSSPNIGSIGTAIELGTNAIGGEWIPLIVGAPANRRYQAFGQLFAAAKSGIHRLDRHPVMSRHPTTPMNEADLGRHLSEQTDLKVGVVDLAAMKNGHSDQALEQCLADGASILALDVVDDETLVEAGRLIWQGGNKSVFVAGSQGVQYALVAHWRACGMLDSSVMAPELAPVKQIFAISGSCAQTTADQIDYAQDKGFKVLDFDATTAIDSDALSAEIDRVLKLSLSLLSDGNDVIVATARGPDHPAVSNMTKALDASGISRSEVYERLGQALGQLISEVHKETNLPRIALAGGDTSGQALTVLGAEALSAIASLAPGSPMCRIHSRANADIDGLEVTLKGGQLGSVEFFVHAKTGGSF